MATTTVIVRNLIPAVAAVAHGRAAAATRKAAFDVEAQAKARAPVDTGFLRSAIHTTGADVAYQVHSDADYSLYQEFGTHRIPAHPYMVPAAEFVRPSYLAALKRIV